MGIAKTRFRAIAVGICLAFALAHISRAEQTSPAPSGQAASQSQRSGTQANSTPQQNNDSEVLSVVHAADQIGIRAGRLAQERTQSAEVRGVADRIVSDSQRTEQGVTAIANRERVSITNPPAGAKEKLHQFDQELARLQTLQGEEFDKAFLDFNHKGDQEAMQALKMKENQPISPEVRNFLSASVLPALQQHVNESHDVKKGLDNQDSSAHR